VSNDGDPQDPLASREQGLDPNTSRLSPAQQALPMPGALTSVAATSTRYTGPIPSPDMLADYERVQPGLGKSLVEAFLAEGEHRRESERRTQRHVTALSESQMRNATLGVWLGFGVVVILAGVSVYAITLGYPWAASCILGADVAGLVAVFVHGRSAQRDEELARISNESEDPEGD